MTELPGLGRGDVGGLVEALVAIHKPTKTWGTGAKPDNCSSCHETWPCQTLRLVAEVTGSKCPDQQISACDGAVSTGDGGWLYCHGDRGHDGDCTSSDGRHGPFIHMAVALGLALASDEPEG